ncbi:MAG: undecaprenyl-diphosphatase, partial [Chloroflexota bacterium]|nr:undecaprenyl-diphosphatase [Chloroflexota bacterium]
MDTLVAALIMGVVQGLTEFLPVSSSGHLILVPYLLGPYLPGMRDPFITSLEFSVILHIGTLIALLIYFRADWLRLVPAFFGAVRDRSLGSDPDRRLALDLTIPQALAIGGAQAIALIPGISRSGISISAGLFAGLKRDEA